MDAEIVEQLERRDRFRRHQWRLMTWAQRWEALDRLQAKMRAMAALSPLGMAHFHRRNHRARATKWVDPDGV